MEHVQDTLLTHAKGKSLCTANFQNKSKALARVELVFFGSQVFPFRIDPVLNMTTRIDVEKAGRKLPNPVFESLPYLNSSSVIHGKVEYGYCEIRGLDDVELNVKKTAEFLLLQKWVGVVHMSDNSKMYVIPTSDLSQRLGLSNTSISHVLHGLFTRKLPYEADPQTEASENVLAKFHRKSKKHVLVNLTSDSDNDCAIVEHPQAHKSSASSLRKASRVVPKDPESVTETPPCVLMFVNQSTSEHDKKYPKATANTPSPPSRKQDTIDIVAIPHVTKSSSKNVKKKKKKKSKMEPVLTEQTCSAPADVGIKSQPPIELNLLNVSRSSMEKPDGTSAVDTSMGSPSSSTGGARWSTSSGILNVSSVGSMNSSPVGIKDMVNESSVCDTSVSFVGVWNTPNTSSVCDTSVSLVGAWNTLNTSSVCDTTVSLVGVWNTPNTSSVCDTSIPSVRVGDAQDKTRGEDAHGKKSSTGKGGRGGRGKRKDDRGGVASDDVEGQGKILTRKRGKESLNSGDSASNPEMESKVKKKRRTEKPAVERKDEQPSDCVDDVICMKVPHDVQLQDLVGVIPDIQGLEAEATSIIREELPLTVPQTPVSTVVSLLSKKPKKSCLSKPWAAAVHQSSPTRTENIAQPFIDGEVTTIGSCTPPQQLSSAEDATPAVKEVNEMASIEEVTSLANPLHIETEDPLDNGLLSFKAPKKVSLAEYKSRRRPTLDGRGKDSLQTSHESETEPPPKGSPKASPISVGSPRDIPIYPTSSATQVPTPSTMISGVAPSIASVSSQTIPLPSTPITTMQSISSVPLDESLFGTKQNTSLSTQQRNYVPSTSCVVLSPLHSNLSPIEPISRTVPLWSNLEAKATTLYKEPTGTTLSCSGSESVSCTKVMSETETILQAPSLILSAPVDSMNSPAIQISEANLLTPVGFTLRDVLTNPVYPTPTNLPCHNPPTDNVLQSAHPLSQRSPPSTALAAASSLSNLKPSDSVIDPLPNICKTSDAVETQRKGIRCSNLPSNRCVSHLYRRSSSPPALLSVSTPLSSTPTTLSLPSSSLHSTADPIPPPLSSVYDSPSFHLMCTSSPQMNTPNAGSTTDMSKSPELALELSSDHPTELTVIAEPLALPTAPLSPSVPVPVGHSTAVLVHESPSSHQNVEWGNSASQISSHLDANTFSSTRTTNVDGIETILSSPQFSAATIHPAQSCHASVQNSASVVYHSSPYSICQPFSIPQTRAFYLPGYYPYSHHILPCVPSAPSSIPIPYVYPWTTAYGSMYQHYAATSITSSSSPSFQPRAWMVAQRALASQHLQTQSKSPKLPINVVEGEGHRGVQPTMVDKGTDMDVVCISSPGESALLADCTIQLDSSHKRTEAVTLLGVTTAGAAVGTCDAAVQAQLTCQAVCGVDVGVQTGIEETHSPVAKDASCSNVSDIDEAVWKARQWLIHEIKYDAIAEVDTENDVENSQGSLPSPVISGASNISDGDLVSNSASSDWVLSPSKDNSTVAQCPVDFPYVSDSSQRRSPNTPHDPPPLLEFPSHIYSTPPYTSCSTPPLCPSNSTPPPCSSDTTHPCPLSTTTEFTSYTSPPYTLYASPPYTSYSTTPRPYDSTPPRPYDSTPPCPYDSTPPCPYDSTPLCPHDSTPPCPHDSTPPRPYDSTPPHTYESTPPHTYESTLPPCPPDATPPHTSDSTPPPCPPDFTPPYAFYSTPPYTSYSIPPCPSDSTPPYCTSPQPLEPIHSATTVPMDCIVQDSIPHHPLNSPAHFTHATFATSDTFNSDTFCQSAGSFCSAVHTSSVSGTVLATHLGSSPPSSPPQLLDPMAHSSTIQCSTKPLDADVHLPVRPLTPPPDSCISYTVKACLPSHPLMSSHLTDVTSLYAFSGSDLSGQVVNSSHPGSYLCSADTNERNLSSQCEAASGQLLSLTEKHVAEQLPQQSSIFVGIDHVRAMSLPPLSSRGSNTSGSPTPLSPVAIEDDSVFEFTTKLPQRSSSLSPSVTQKFRNPPVLGKPKITMSAAEILAKVRAKRSSQPSLPIVEEQQQLEQLSMHSLLQEVSQPPLPSPPPPPSSPPPPPPPSSPPPSPPPPPSSPPPSQQNKMGVTTSGSRTEWHGIDLEQLMKKCRDHMEKKQKKKKQDKSWRHIRSTDISQYSGWYGVYPTPTTLPNHPLLDCHYGAVPETALLLSSVANSNENNCKDKEQHADCSKEHMSADYSREQHMPSKEHMSADCCKEQHMPAVCLKEHMPADCSKEQLMPAGCSKEHMSADCCKEQQMPADCSKEQDMPADCSKEQAMPAACSTEKEHMPADCSKVHMPADCSKEYIPVGCFKEQLMPVDCSMEQVMPADCSKEQLMPADCSKEQLDCSKEQLDCSKEQLDCSKEQLDCSKEQLDCSKEQLDCSKEQLDCSKEQLDCSKEQLDCSKEQLDCSKEQLDCSKEQLMPADCSKEYTPVGCAKEQLMPVDCSKEQHLPADKEKEHMPADSGSEVHPVGSDLKCKGLQTASNTYQQESSDTVCTPGAVEDGALDSSNRGVKEVGSVCNSRDTDLTHLLSFHRLPSALGTLHIVEKLDETTQNICRTSGEQLISAEGIAVVEKQFASNVFGSLCCTNIHKAEERSANSHLNEEVMLGSETVREGEHGVSATMDHMTGCSTVQISSPLCGLADDYEHIPMDCSSVLKSDPNVALPVCNFRGNGPPLSGTTPVRRCGRMPSLRHHLSNDRQSIGTERVSLFKDERYNEGFGAMGEKGTRMHMGTAFEVGNCGFNMSTANVRKGKLENSALGFPEEQSSSGVISTVIASGNNEGVVGTVGSNVNVDKSYKPVPYQEPPQDPQLVLLEGCCTDDGLLRFRSREEIGNWSFDNLHPYVAPNEKDSSVSNANRSEVLLQRGQQQTLEQRSSDQLHNPVQVIPPLFPPPVGSRSVQYGSSAGKRPLMDLPISHESIRRNIAGLFKGSRLPARARAVFYNRYIRPRGPRQLQVNSRQSHVGIGQHQDHTHIRQDHVVTLQRGDSSSQQPQPLFGASLIPSLVDGRLVRESWPTADGALCPSVHPQDVRPHRNTYSSNEDFTVNNAFNTFGNNFNPSGTYLNQISYTRSRYPHSHFHNQL